MRVSQDLVLWYGVRKEPNIQISILREIGINGKQTKSELANNLGYGYSTIDNTISRNETLKIERHLFWRNGMKNKLGTKQPLYSLTNRAMKILMLCHYKDNDENIKQMIVGKPYLNSDEFLKFISIFEKEHKYIEIIKNHRPFKHPLKPLISLYLTSNSSIIDQLGSKFKNNKELQKLVSSIKSDELELQRINEKTIQLKENIQMKKYEMGGILPNMLISPQKK